MIPDHLAAVLLGGFEYPRPDERAYPETVWFRLPDGLPLGLRPIHPEDRDSLVAGLVDLSPDSPYRRLLAPMQQLSEQQAAYLTGIDHARHFSWIAGRHNAAGDERSVGIARYILDPADDGSAEVVVVVADNLHGRGIGTVLVHALVAVAAGHGVTHLYGYASDENRAMHRLFERLGATCSVAAPGVTRADVALHGAIGVALEPRAVTDLTRLAAAAAHPSRWHRLD